MSPELERQTRKQRMNPSLKAAGWRMTDFTDDHRVDMADLKWLKPETQRAIARYTISAHDVYISIAATIGMVGRVQPELDGANLTENAAKITDLQGVNPDYLVAWLASPLGRAAIAQRITSSGQPKLALFRIAGIPVPLPPLEEQDEIVRRLKRLARLAAGIQTRIERARRSVDRSSQSVLARAFRGDLVTVAPTSSYRSE